MASTVMKSNRLKRNESKKSHSWWWDSHISPKNSKWLQENLEEMDQHVKRMLKLIEEDADSFAKKAELYFKKRPELVSLVEQFYRMYRSLAERYDIVTGELKKNIPIDLQSQGSGISEASSEPPSTIPSPEQRPNRTKSGPRAAGFDVFLKSGGSGSDLNRKNKEGDESSSLDSDSESDDSSVNNYSSTDDEHGLQKRITELEAELREVKEKYEDFKKSNHENSEVYAKIATYEEELRVANEKIQLSEDEITRLTIELQKCSNLSKDSNDLLQESTIEPEALGSAREIGTVEEELRITKTKLHDLEEDIVGLRQNLQDNLKSAQKESSIWKNKLENEKREASKLLERITRYKTNISDRDQEIRVLKETVSNANKSLSEENERLKAEMTTLTKERAHLEDRIKEVDLNRQSLEDEVRRVKAILRAQIEQLKADISEREENVDELKIENNSLQSKIITLESEMSSKDKEINTMSYHLHELHMQHVELITRAERAQKRVEEMGSRVKELETEIERKEEIIVQGAEEKREAIRQLCFSLEHYRNGYHQLREAVSGHKGPAIVAS